MDTELLALVQSLVDRGILRRQTRSAEEMRERTKDLDPRYQALLLDWFALHDGSDVLPTGYRFIGFEELFPSRGSLRVEDIPPGWRSSDFIFGFRVTTLLCSSDRLHRIGVVWDLPGSHDVCDLPVVFEFGFKRAVLDARLANVVHGVVDPVRWGQMWPGNRHVVDLELSETHWRPREEEPDYAPFSLDDLELPDLAGMTPEEIRAWIHADDEDDEDTEDEE